MSEKIHPIVELLQQDQRYHIEAYQFVREALAYAQEIMKLPAAPGATSVPDPSGELDPSAEVDTGSELDPDAIEKELRKQDVAPEDVGEPSDEDLEALHEDDDFAEPKAPEGHEHHITGQQLCEAIRQYALEQFGFMSKTVLNNWGVHSTSDFGEIVYNLIRIRHMKKSTNDRREDFDEVYDFAHAFEPVFEHSSSDQG